MPSRVFMLSLRPSGEVKMKTKQVWAEEILKYLQDNPVKSSEEVMDQIEQIVDWVQKDTIASLAPAEGIRMQ